VSFEIPAAAAVIAADPTGHPTRQTNLWDLQRETAMPPRESYVPCPPGYSHAAPDTHTPYPTGDNSLPKENDDE
jgi:hypothetical protein